MYSIRIKKLRERLKKEKIEALIVSDRTNIEYLTGFSGTYGFVLIHKKDVYLFTDSRYYQRCKKEVAGGVKIRLVKDDWLLHYRLKRLGFEACSVNYDTYRKWRRKFKGVKLVPTRFLIEQVRMIKQPEELKAIQGAVRITEDIVKKIKKRLKVGISEIDLARQIEKWIRDIYHTVPAFTPIVVYGVDSSMPHASLSKKRLQNNQLILIDLGVKFQGYSSDLTRTFWMGRITRKPPHQKLWCGGKFKEIYNIVLTAQRMAIDNVVPGQRISEVDNVARSYIKKQGYGRYFGHPVGHGIGMFVHEIPRIGPGNKHYLKPGMIFSVEPGIYIPGWGGVRIEDMVLVTEKGCKVLTNSKKKLDEIILR